MQVWRTVVSLVAGAIVGLFIAGLVGIPRLVGPANVVSFVSNAFTFWGLVFGTFAAVVTAGLTFAILNRGNRKTSRWGRIIAGIVLALFAAATWWWIAIWGFSPFSLEGLSIYPLALTATAGAVFLLRRRGPDAWDEPPGL